MIQSFLCPTTLHLGVGAHERISDVLSTLGSNNVFICVDAAVRGSEIMGRIEAALRARCTTYGIFSDIEPDPSDTTVERAFAGCAAAGATAILALGGGSTIDVAKAVGILMTNGGRIHDYEGIEKYRIPPLPLVAIPTTAGTGSEVSGSCVITDTARHLKMSIRHASLNPARFAILDPIALRTMPAHVAMHSGMDAFVHAFESYVARGASPFTDALNLHALELISGSIRGFVADRLDDRAGLDMLCGSALAGMAFGQTGLGNVHCLARFVGSFFHLSHGLSNAVCLPHVAAFNRPACVGRYARLAPVLGGKGSTSEEEASHETVQLIQELCRDLDVPPRLRDVGGRAEVFGEMADLCVEAGYNRWNPRETTRQDFLELLDEAY